METPHKDHECEKQLMALTEADEFSKRNSRSEFMVWKRKIKPLYEILGTKPDATCALGKLMVSGVGSDSENDEMLSESINSELLAKCHELYDGMHQTVVRKKSEALAVWNEVKGFWNEVEKTEEFALCFTNAESGILNSLVELKAQYISRRKDKSRRLREFIFELRKEMSDIWEQCMITEEEKRLFVEYESTDFTENMLQIHKDELQRWKIYHKKNQEILLKVQKRDTMWKKLRELEAKATDPSRFVNRGGSLLKDQNMHNFLLKNLPKLENELIGLAKKFELEHGKKMTILGKEIPLMIEKEWETFKEERSGRKNTRTAPTPPKPILQSIRRSIAPCSSTNIPPQIRPLEKRFGSKLELSTAPATKRTKMQPLKAVQDNE